MKKAELKELLKNNLKVVQSRLDRIFGVSMGVGYDYTIEVQSTAGVQHTIKLNAHGKAWHLAGHRNSNQYAFNVYKGSNAYPERYWSTMQDNFASGSWLYEYLSRFTKTQLVELVKLFEIEV